MNERKRMPKTREAIVHKFNVGGVEGYITVGLYEDGTPGELFLKIAKEGSTISGLLEALSLQTSLALQYGVPLKTMVDKLSFLRFEPSGHTGTELKFATSIVDYIFRWMKSRFIKEEPKSEESINTDAKVPEGLNESSAPMCGNCGTLTVRAGSCYCCPQCGASTGCS